MYLFLFYFVFFRGGINDVLWKFFGKLRIFEFINVRGFFFRLSFEFEIEIKSI